MRKTALKTSPQPHWAPRLIEPAEGAFFTRAPVPAPADRTMPPGHRLAIVRLLFIGLGLNMALWTGLAVEAVQIW